MWSPGLTAADLLAYGSCPRSCALRRASSASAALARVSAWARAVCSRFSSASATMARASAAARLSIVVPVAGSSASNSSPF